MVRSDAVEILRVNIDKGYDHQIVGKKTKGRISKWGLQENKARQINTPCLLLINAPRFTCGERKMW